MRPTAGQARRAALRRGLRGAIAAVLGVMLAMPASAGPALGIVAVTFGVPTATTTYDQSIEFRVPVTGASAIDHAELQMRFPDTIGPYVVGVPVPGSGAPTLMYTLDLTGGGHLVPNTTLVVQWVAVTTAGERVSSASLTVRYADTTHDWMTVKGELMTVHWYQGSKAFAQRALAIGEQAIRDTSSLLGVTETAPVDFFIYADDASFRDALGPGTRENVGGQAHADIRTLFALITPDAINDPWVGVVIPHELVHLVFDTAVRNPYRFPPRWLNEGLAVYLSEGYSASDRGLVSDAVQAKDLIPLDALGGQFPTDAQKTYLAYAESVSAIDYLVRTDGQDALLALVRAYKGGLTDDEAFSRAVGQDLGAFQAGWLQELGAAPPVRYGPQPAPAGPLPPGWSGTGGTPAPGAATSAPSLAPAPSAATTPASGNGSDAGLLVLSVVAVIVVVAAGLLVARRRSQVA